MDQPPRNPRDLQGLLKFCLETTKGEDAPDVSGSALESMDPERREWLRKAIEDMSVDVFQELAKCVEILSDHDVIMNEEASVERPLYAFECIEDWVGQVDMANNFQRLGGFTALRLCLASPHERVAAGACHIVAELAQNNPHCQQALLDDKMLDEVLKIAKEDARTGVKTKALYAVSSTVRSFPPGYEAMKKLNGFEVVLQLLQIDDVTLRTKACFLLASLMQEHPDLKAELTRMGLCELLFAVLNEEHGTHHEHVARTLVAMLENNPEAVKACHDLPLNLSQLLEDRVKFLEGKEEFLEERDYCKELKKHFGGVKDDVDR